MSFAMWLVATGLPLAFVVQGPLVHARTHAGDSLTVPRHHFHDALWRRRPEDVVVITVSREGRLVETRARLGVSP